MKRMCVMYTCLVGLLALPLGAQNPRPSGPVRLESTEDGGHCLVYGLAWDSGNDWWDQSEAWMVVPKTKVRAAVLYLHMYGNNIGPEQFLLEAKDLAAKGVASILPQGTVPWLSRWSGDESDPELLDWQVKDIQVALDYLAAQNYSDPARIAVVGHDYGAMNALVMMNRGIGFKAAVLLAPSPWWSDWIRYFNPEAPREYDRLFGRDQPLTALAALQGIPVLLQFGDQDYYVSPQMVEQFRKVAGSATFQVLPGSNHDSIAQDGRVSRENFITKALGL